MMLFENIKCYPLANAVWVGEGTPRRDAKPDWRILEQVSEDLYVLSQIQANHVRYAPLYVHHLTLRPPKQIPGNAKQGCVDQMDAYHCFLRDGQA